MLIPSIQERKTWLVFLISLLVGLNLYFNFSYTGGLEGRAKWIDQAFLQVFSPIQYGVAQTKIGLRSSLFVVKEMWSAREENQELRFRLSELSLRLQQQGEIEAENTRLRELLEFRERQPMEYLVARVIAKDPSAFFKTVMIDRGRESGVEEGMPVVSAEGVVGRIQAVGPLSSRVLLINDVNSRVDAVIQRSRARTIVAGGLGGTLNLRFLPRRQDIRVDDLVVTSGLGESFPAGFRIGWVSEVKRDPNVVLEEAKIRAAVNFDSVEEVFVIRGRQQSQEGLNVDGAAPRN
ncbi:MAG: rod shape-determining protein MreC [Bradymonadales bacterium]|nr:MAG: rod shape-determining protein MreC [Bradymonadales bacterium]